MMTLKDVRELHQLTLLEVEQITGVAMETLLKIEQDEPVKYKEAMQIRAKLSRHLGKSYSQAKLIIATLPIRNRLWRVSWQEGVYSPALCFEASTSQEAVQLFQEWLRRHRMTVPVQVKFDVALITNNEIPV